MAGEMQLAVTHLDFQPSAIDTLVRLNLQFSRVRI